MHGQEFHLIRASGGLFAFRKSSRNRHAPSILRILLGTRAYFSPRSNDEVVGRVTPCAPAEVPDADSAGRGLPALPSRRTRMRS
jgi:hypothetical protein